MHIKNIRWRRWIAGLASLIAIYTVVGFWLVPLMIKNQVPKFGQTELARQASIGEVRFNPYTLRLTVHDLRLAETDSAPLLAIGKLTIALQWRSLVQRAWHFTEIRIAAPNIVLAIAADGKFNIAELLATLERKPATAATAMPRLIIEQFVLEQGKVALRDQRAGYTDNFSPINFALSNFSTLPDSKGMLMLSADSERGGKLLWKGEASVNPIRGSGQLTLEKITLPGLGAYLKAYAKVSVGAGQLDATLPYQFSYGAGKLDARLAGAKVALHDLGLAQLGASDTFATLTVLEIDDVNADLVRRDVSIGELRAGNGALSLRRNANGEIDLANLPIKEVGSSPSPKPNHVVANNNWKLALKKVTLDQVAIYAVDETVSPSLRVKSNKLRVQLQLKAEQANNDFKLAVTDATLALDNLVLTSGKQAPLKLAQLGFSGGSVDLAARHASVGLLYAKDGQLQLIRDSEGQLNLLGLLPKAGPASQLAAAVPAAGVAQPWTARADKVALSQFGAQIEDQVSGIKVQVLDLGATLEGASSDLAQSVRFEAALQLGSGGQLAAQGGVIPASGALKADVTVTRLALAPLQPLLSKYLKLKLASGSVSAKGLLTSTPTQSGAKAANLRYVGGIDIANLALNEADGIPFAAWKSVSAEILSASFAPNLLEIPLLRVVEPNATLIIENDRSLNAARLLVRPGAAGAGNQQSAPSNTAAPPMSQLSAHAAIDPFPVRIQRLRFENAKLDFNDRSLRPQFGAKIYELNGVISGLSSATDARSQITLDGRVDAFGLARVRGSLNPFAPRDNTNVNVVFRNINMVSASPYTMKFAGYKIAEGKISLDLQYKVRDSKLEGTNQVVVDNLVLGERVDSPDALKLPLQLAIAILKDSDGRIELGLPVTGDLNDPQFSYGAVVWKALSNVLTRIVSAPFRALGNLFGSSAESHGTIAFDPGSDRLLPPEQEKLQQLAQMLTKRTQLKLSVPGQYSEIADGAALKAQAVRNEVARRAGVKREAGTEAGVIDLGNRATRSALRELYAERFGAPALEQQKTAAENAAASTTPSANAAKGTPEKLPLLQRVGNLVQGEPQVADSRAFYRQLREHLNQAQPVAPAALTELGARRAKVIVSTLEQYGINADHVSTTAPENIKTEAGKPVPVNLALAAKRGQSE